MLRCGSVGGGGSRDPPGPVVRLEYLATMMMTVAPRRPLLSGSHAAQFTSGFGWVALVTESLTAFRKDILDNNCPCFAAALIWKVLTSRLCSVVVRTFLGIETGIGLKTLAIRSWDQYRDLDRMNSSALESRDHNTEFMHHDRTNLLPADSWIVTLL